MKTIQIDSEVYAEIEGRVRGFHQTPNDVLRHELGLKKASGISSEVGGSKGSALREFLQSSDYKLVGTADERYLRLVSWLIHQHPEVEIKLEGFRTRQRILFSSERKQIEQTSLNATVKAVPDSKLHAMMTLSNQQKRRIMRLVLLLAGYDTDVIEAAVEPFQDTGIKRARLALDLGKYR